MKKIIIISILLISIIAFGAMRLKFHDLTIEKGATFDPIIAWEDENGARIDLTGCSAQMQIRRDVDSSPSFNLSTTNNGISLQTVNMATDNVPSGSVTGTIKIVIPAVQTSTINFQDGVYDVNVTFGDGRVWKLLFGNVRTVENITH